MLEHVSKAHDTSPPPSMMIPARGVRALLLLPPTTLSVHASSHLDLQCPRFEKQKREQELQAAKHLDLGSGGEGSSSESDSETEDEDAEMLTPALDLQVLLAANKTRASRR